MKLLFAGDFCIQGSEEIEIEESVLGLFHSVDYRIINFEGAIGDNINPDVIKSGPRVLINRSSKRLLNDLKVDGIALANNHSMDNGAEGLMQTRTYLDDYSLMGAGFWEEAYKPCILSGGKIAILNVCEMQFGMLSDRWVQGNDAIGCAWINHPCINSIIVNLKQKVDVLIAICHAGVENIEVPLPEWRTRYRELIDVGCDAVVAHHPHIVQGFEIYNGKPICYSLGNFCFPQSAKRYDEKWNTGALCVFDIQSGKTTFEMHGCCLDGNKLRLVDEEKWTSEINKKNSYLEDGIYMKMVNENCRQLLGCYWNLFAMGGLFNPKSMSFKNVGRIVLGRYNHVHLLNNIQCESHRWCISRALQNEIGL